MALTVCCCLWGEFPDKGWSEEYVRRLKDGVARNLTERHRFVCFADRVLEIDGVEGRPLKPPTWEGKLPKTFVYSPDAGLEGRVLLLDLDNVITGSLDDIAAYRGRLCVRGRFGQVAGRRLPDGDMIAFDAGECDDLWEAAQRPDLLDAAEGRERDFILFAAPDADQWQDVCPGQIRSYRLDVARNGLDGQTRIVSFHGRPRPHQVNADWVKENWR